MLRIRSVLFLAAVAAVTSHLPWLHAQTPGALALNQTIVFPADAGVINVKDAAYGAVGDGVTDDTNAILAAIAAAAPQGGYPVNYVSEYKIVYFPAGTYLVSRTLQRYQTQGGTIPDCGLVLVGESMGGSIIKLKDNTFTTSSAVTPVIKTFSLGHTSGVSGFHNMIHNVTVDVGSGNPNATGISYLANNTSSIRNVTIRNLAMSGGSNGSGIEMNRISTGPALIENVTVDGFATGITMQSTQCSIVLEHLSLLNQAVTAVSNTDNEMVINALYTSGSGTSLVNASSTGGQRTGMIVINNSSLNRSGSSADMASNAGVIVFHNTTFSYGQSFLGGSTSAEGAWIAGANGGANSYQPAVAPSLTYTSATAVADTPIVPYPAASAWVRPAAISPATAVRSADFTVNYSGCASAYGCLPSGTSPIDATQSIQNALNSGASTIYLPHGIYYINAPLVVPQSVQRIIGVRSGLRVMPNITSWPSGQGMLHVATSASSGCPSSSSCPPVVIEYLRFDGTGAPSVFRSAAYAIDVTNAAGTGAAAKRDVVVRDVESGLSFGINRQADGGRLFLEDVASGSLLLDGSAIVEGRHFNSEDVNDPPSYVGTTRIKNYGAPLWLLGMKTEGPINIFDLKNSSRTVVLGGFFYTAPSLSPSQGGGRDADTVSATTCADAGNPVPSASSTPALFISDSTSTVEASFVEELSLLTYQGATQLPEQRRFPFYYANPSLSYCQTGGFSNGAIQRGTAGGPGESGYSVPLLSH